MTIMSEQETTVTSMRGEPFVLIWTANPVHLRKLRKDTRVIEVSGGDEWAQFKVPSENFDPLKGFKRERKPLTEEQRAAASERLAKARAAKNSDREPRPTDGPDYHAEHAAWRARQ